MYIILTLLLYFFFIKLQNKTKKKKNCENDLTYIRISYNLQKKIYFLVYFCFSSSQKIFRLFYGILFTGLGVAPHIFCVFGINMLRRSMNYCASHLPDKSSRNHTSVVNSSGLNLIVKRFMSLIFNNIQWFIKSSINKPHIKQ